MGKYFTNLLFELVEHHIQAISVNQEAKSIFIFIVIQNTTVPVYLDAKLKILNWQAFSAKFDTVYRTLESRQNFRFPLCYIFTATVCRLE